MEYSHYIIMLTLSFLVGCQGAKQNQFERVLKIDPTEVDQPKFEDMVKSIEYIPLETTDQSLIGEIENLVVADGRFFINSDRKSILCFSDDGKFLFKIGNIGRGPGEFISPFSISVDNGVVYVACQERGNLLCYDATDGKFLQSLKLPKHYVQVVVSGGYIYGMDMTSKPFAIDAMSIEKIEKPIELYATTKGEYVYSAFTQMFKSGDNSCYWVDPLRGQVYELAGGKMIPYIDFDFGEYEYDDKTIREGQCSNNNTRISGIENFYRVGDIATLSFGGGDKDLHTMILNLHNGNIINMGFMSYRGEPAPGGYYKKAPYDIIAAEKRFYQVCSSHYHDECGELPSEYISYKRMRGLDPQEANPTIIAYELNIP